jgi:putative flavoprotein involved in K+ transport
LSDGDPPLATRRAIERITTVVIGAGHAGLAISRVLAEHSIDHVVLERGEVANSWRHERWDSLRLLTPNWQSRLPGYPYSGAHPDDFMTMPEVVQHISGFAAATSAPLRTQTTVTSVRRLDAEYQVVTDRGEIHCRTVVIASGGASIARVPEVSTAVPERIECLTPFEYHNPDRLPSGGVLVVGASATGVQLAHEILRSGRPVTLCVGEHVRLPRTYRGRDVLWWMEKSGVWNERYDKIDDLERARGLPSPQLVGTPERATLDLNVLREAGVEVVGRLAAIRDGCALFSGGLANQFALADLKMGRLLDTFDEWARAATQIEVGPPERFEPTRPPQSPRLSLNLRRGEIRSIVWATGFRPDYRWLNVSVVNRRGHLHHDGGVVVGAPGMYAIGLPVLRRRKSTFILGAEDDARDIVGYVLRYLAHGINES